MLSLLDVRSEDERALLDDPGPLAGWRMGVHPLTFSLAAAFDEARRGLAHLGKIKIVRGLGKAAFLYTPDPLDAGRELYVFHPSKTSPVPGLPPGPEAGAFAVLSAGLPGVPVRSLVALARVVLKHPIRPLKSPKQ